MRKLLWFMALTLYSVALCATPDYLFHNGATDYSIVLPSNASESEKTAAAELQSYIRKVSGTLVPIGADSGKKRSVVIGWTPETGIAKPADNDEGFTYLTRNGNLYICGGKERGTMYGVFAFLENELGIHWFSKDFTALPPRRQYVVGDLRYSSKPAFAYRQVLYYTSIVDHDWDAHNKLNFGYGRKVNNSYGGLQLYFGVHTMGEMMASDAFAKHPEYFALYRGKRIADGQLCLSNPDVLKLITDGTLGMIKSQPGCWCYSVSQNDNNKFCECAKCRRIEKKYGGYTGLLIWFVNQVADNVKQKYPDAMIGTLAYHYTQTPPKNIKPRANVNIRMCVDGCYFHPVTSGENAKFYNDLKGWNLLTQNIVIWDYATNFYHYLIPVPNIDNVAANMRTYKLMGLDGVMEQGQYDGYGGEFFELKQWVFAKLLWNPFADADSLVRTFIYGYYGKAAGKVLEYYELTKKLVDGNHFYFETRFNSPIYTDDYLRNSRCMLDEALLIAGNDSVAYSNVEKLRVSVLYLQVMKNKQLAMLNGDAEILKAFLNKYKWKEREGKDYTTFVKEMGFW